MTVRYTIYSHADTDGAVAAALLFSHLRATFGAELDLVVRPVDHTTPDSARGGGWSMMALSPPCAVLDFSLHPSLLAERFGAAHPALEGRGGTPLKSYWIDHHETGSPFSFVTPSELDRYFSQSVCAVWDPAASSTPALMRREASRLGIDSALLDRFSYAIDVADIVDAARFESPAAAHDFGEFSVRLQHLITSRHPLVHRDRLYCRLVEGLVALAERVDASPVDSSLGWHSLVDQDPIYAALLEHEERQLNRRRQAYQQVLRCEGQVVVCDFREREQLWCGLGRFVPYELVSEAAYAVHIAPANRSGECAVTCGVNPWRPQTSGLNLGHYFARSLSGGGHAYVAGGKISKGDSAAIDRLVGCLSAGSDLT